jgi:hypothetical protein
MILPAAALQQQQHSPVPVRFAGSLSQKVQIERQHFGSMLTNFQQLPDKRQLESCCYCATLILNS